MIVPVNVAPNSLQAPAQTQQAASQQLAFSSPDLNAVPSLKKSVRLQARSVTANNLDSSQQELVDEAASPQDSLSKVNQKNQSVRSDSKQLVAQAALNNGLPSDVPPLDQIPTLQPQTETLPAVPTSRPESVTPQSNNPNSAQPQQPSDNVVQNSGQSFPPPSRVLPSQNNPNPSGVPSTGTPQQEPANYTPGNNSAPYYNQNYLGPAVSFGNDTLWGANSRFGLGRNFSVRPGLFLGNNTRVTLPLTFDFGLNNNEQFEPNPLLVFHAGGGIEYSSGGASGSSINPLAVAGADIYFGDGASVLVQVGTAFNSNVVGVVGVGLQF